MSRPRAAALRFAAPALAALVSALAAGPLCAQPAGASRPAAVRHAAQVTRGGLLAVLVATLEPVGAVRVQLQDEAGRTLLEVPAVPLGRGGPLRLRLALLGVPSTREAGAYRVQVDGYAALGPPAGGLPAWPRRAAPRPPPPRRPGWAAWPCRPRSGGSASSPR